MKIMKRFVDWYQGNNDVETEPPRGGIKRVGYVLWNYAGKMILINIIFIVSCIPLITIPAALTALNRYIMKIFRTGYGFTLSDYFDEFKKNIGKCIPLGVLTGGIGFYAYYLLSLAGNFRQHTLNGVVVGIGFGVLMIAILLGSYVFVLAAMLDLPARYILKNSLILMTVECMRNLLLVCSVLLFWGLLLAFAPYTLLLVVLCGFSVQQLIVCAFLNPVVERRIIEPYERGKRNT